jgi:transposase
MKRWRGLYPILNPSLLLIVACFPWRAERRNATQKRLFFAGYVTVRDAIHAFNARGVDALAAKSSRPLRTRDAFDEESAEALRELLHRSPRELGRQTSLWTLSMAAEVAFEEEITQRRVSGETIRATLWRLLGVKWQRAKRWITSPDPLLERKKGAATD